MADDKTTKGDTFDIEKLQQLMEMMEKHGVTELKLKSSSQRWHLRRGPLDVPTYNYAPQPMSMAMQPPPVASSPAPASSGESAPAARTADEPNIAYITSPTVGTLYLRPTPDDPPFVKVGDTVTAETTVCLIEAMKVFNQIPAEVSGTIVEIVAQSGSAVAFNDRLFKVKTG